MERNVALPTGCGKHALVAFGANLNFGDLSPSETILKASGQLAAALNAELQLSVMYNTPCFPSGAGPDYINAAAKLTLRNILDPQEILACLHDIEARFGRERSRRWGQRSLDIDLLALDDQILPDLVTQSHWRCLPGADQARLAPQELILPHPRLQDRAFVLVPLANVAPEWRHPVLARTVAEMLAALPAADRAAVVPAHPVASS